MTDTMKPDQKPDQKTHQPPKQPEKRDMIPVSMLKLSDREPMELPGLGGKSSCVGDLYSAICDERGKRIMMRACWVIDFIPAIRHHRVVYFAPDGDKKPPVTRMIWEGHVKLWEPLPL